MKIHSRLHESIENAMHAKWEKPSLVFFDFSNLAKTHEKMHIIALQCPSERQSGPPLDALKSQSAPLGPQGAIQASF